MKTLLIILLLMAAGQCFGQWDEYHEHDNEAMRKIDSAYEAYFRAYIQDCAIDLILEYAEECYNDSTACCIYYKVYEISYCNIAGEVIRRYKTDSGHYTEIVYGRDCNCNLEEYLKERYGDDEYGQGDGFEMRVEKYIHKQVAFEDFIEHLRKKYEE